jgi:hypothetical protein
MAALGAWVIPSRLRFQRVYCVLLLLLEDEFPKIWTPFQLSFSRNICIKLMTSCCLSRIFSSLRRPCKLMLNRNDTSGPSKSWIPKSIRLDVTCDIISCSSAFPYPPKAVFAYDYSGQSFQRCPHLVGVSLHSSPLIQQHLAFPQKAHLPSHLLC